MTGRGRQEKDGGRFRGGASNEMCTFLILNISSLQLIPMNVIAYRKHEIIRIYESSIIFDTITPNQGGIAYE